MEQHIISSNYVMEYEKYMRKEERAEATIQKYLSNVYKFQWWMDGRCVTKEYVMEWKEYLGDKGLSAVSINGAIASLNSFFEFAGWEECKVKYLRIQRRMFRDASRILNKTEYLRLIQAARNEGNLRLALIMETIGGTGVRVSELQYITVEAIARGRAEIALKGKIRTILIPNKLAKKLKQYTKNQKISSGEVFVTSSGKGVSRRQIWGEMKRLSKMAHVDEEKIFPHNLRHLFARSFYKICRDVVSLADVLGHSSVETTRLYLVTSGKEYTRQLGQLGLVL